MTQNNYSNEIDDEVFFANIRKQEYQILDTENHIYLDYTGANLIPKSLLEQHHQLLANHILGNPHSTNPSSQFASDLILKTRQKVLDFFNAKNYLCVFTQNASASLKIIGESYPFDEKSHFVLLSDNHNSVNGIREYCNQKGGTTTYIPLNYENLEINEPSLNQTLNINKQGEQHLFAFPAQSNVTGVKHPLSLIKKAQDLGFDVLLDAAAFVPTSRLDLSEIHPDFVSISFYKIFGYPTGIGCLLIHKSKFDKLKKPWFAGGTVTMVSVTTQKMFLANNYERFEDGTISFNLIPAISNGIDFINKIGMDRISNRIMALTQYLYHELLKLKHHNGTSLVKIFGPHQFENRGGNMIMNFFDVNQKVYPFQMIESMSNQIQISIRFGCFCNPGVDEINNCITNDEMTKYFESRDNGGYEDMFQFLGKMRGATRVSVGIATVKKDIDQFVNLINLLKDKSL